MHLTYTNRTQSNFHPAANAFTMSLYTTPLLAVPLFITPIPLKIPTSAHDKAPRSILLSLLNKYVIPTLTPTFHFSSRLFAFAPFHPSRARARASNRPACKSQGSRLMTHVYNIQNCSEAKQYIRGTTIIISRRVVTERWEEASTYIQLQKYAGNSSCCVIARAREISRYNCVTLRDGG